MARLTYEINIRAPKEKIWQTMLDAAGYRQWTSAFQVGSYFEGTWQKGSTMRFLSADDDGKNGIAGTIVEYIPNLHVSIEYTGVIADGQLDTDSEEARNWIGAHEDYSLSGTDGITTLTVELQGSGFDETMQQMLDTMWPEALETLRTMCE